MKYSAAVAIVLATGAMAAAVPADPASALTGAVTGSQSQQPTESGPQAQTQQSQQTQQQSQQSSSNLPTGNSQVPGSNGVVTIPTGTQSNGDYQPNTSYGKPKYGSDYQNPTYPGYSTSDQYAKSESTANYDYTNSKTYSYNPSYKSSNGAYVDYDTHSDWKYMPVQQQPYTNQHQYYPSPPSYDSSKGSSYYSNLQWPANVCVGKPCQINYTPAHDDDTNIYVYSCDNYDTPYEKVCDSCGQNSYAPWQPKSDCKPSDAQNGSTYRFKFCKKSDETQYTWGCEFNIWNPDYYQQNPSAQQQPSSCPPPVQPPTCPNEAAPTYTSTPATSAAPSSTEAPAACDSCTAAPAGAAPAGTAAEASPEAPASNATTPTVEASSMGAAGALRASVSLVAAVAAFITFAL